MPTTEKCIDGEHEPYLRVCASEGGNYAIVTSKYTRSYRDGQTAERIVAQIWSDGAVLHDQWDMDLRSLEKMYPLLVVASDAPEPGIEMAPTPRFR